ncbi:MAG: UDP-3-O-[3-hydroxymyristoyl] N-acetylglucosamine deacetylase [Methylobacteriaceae bacterium]|nr:UDP-3-O-[3-hydroxymyristoyl] N-acetylglucosamine deacetylase [Methylobacteriaceae bacterium]MBV9393957.1 UDP-3-O-[3-hydroxymyristoyl] N-acetylglucosamine deacetylase [Methylobacteriaceae bacterium]
MFQILQEPGSPIALVLARARQQTVKRPVALRGIGVHSNAPAQLTLSPARANTGIVFEFCRAAAPLAATWTNVVDTTLRTTLGQDDASVSTVEHLLSACAGLGIDNLRVQIDGPELPAFDGSAGAFVDAFDEAEILQVPQARRQLKVLAPVRVQHNGSFAEFLPARQGLTLDIEIDFAAAVIGRQRKILTLDAGTFRRELARARSFGFLRDLSSLQAQGLALGASLDNTVALLDDAVLNPDGVRFPDECVRHKMLDALGDLALAGAPIAGIFRSYRGGHELNVAAVRALMSDPSAFSLESIPDAQVLV